MKTSLPSILKRRLISTVIHSMNGLSWAWKKEESFRVEVILASILIPVAYILGKNLAEFLILILSLIMVVIVELLNTAVEKTIDRISLETNETSKIVKDLGSAAVFLTIICASSIWLYVLLH